MMSNTLIKITENGILPEDATVWKEEEFNNLAIFLLEERGFSLGGYKYNYLVRRISLRLKATKQSSLSKYLSILKTTPEEVNNLYDALTINVSSFFRNSGVFDYLAEYIFPELIKRKKSENNCSIKIWSLGCATGEEAYSIIFLIRKHFELRLKKFNINIIATDIDENALAVAEKGIYPYSKVKDLDPKILRTCFIHDKGYHQIRNRYRQFVSFIKQDIFDFKQMPSPFDLILCRNMMIYFSPNKHKQIYTYISSQLSDNGFLVLGKSEIMFYPSENNFENINIENRIYKKTSKGAV